MRGAAPRLRFPPVRLLTDRAPRPGDRARLVRRLRARSRVRSVTAWTATCDWRATPSRARRGLRGRQGAPQGVQRCARGVRLRPRPRRGRPPGPDWARFDRIEKARQERQSCQFRLSWRHGRQEVRHYLQEARDPHLPGASRAAPRGVAVHVGRGARLLRLGLQPHERRAQRVGPALDGGHWRGGAATRRRATRFPGSVARARSWPRGAVRRVLPRPICRCTGAGRCCSSTTSSCWSALRTGAPPPPPVPPGEAAAMPSPPAARAHPDHGRADARRYARPGRQGRGRRPATAGRNSAERRSPRGLDAWRAPCCPTYVHAVRPRVCDPAGALFHLFLHAPCEHGRTGGRRHGSGRARGPRGHRQQGDIPGWWIFAAFFGRWPVPFCYRSASRPAQVAAQKCARTLHTRGCALRSGRGVVR